MPARLRPPPHAIAAALLALSSLGCTSPGHAEAQWTLGGGLGITSDPLISDVTSLEPYPVLTYEDEHWTVMLGAVRYKAWRSQWLEVSATANVRVADIDDPFVREDDEDAKKRFAGIDREIGADLGVAFVFPAVVPFVLEWRQEVTGADGGGVLTAMLPVPLLDRGAVAVTLALGGRWVTNEYIDYNYGVRPSEARPNRSAYAAAHGAVIPYAGLELTYAFSGRWSLDSSLGYERLDDEITRSPLVEDEEVVSASIAVLYRF